MRNSLIKNNMDCATVANCNRYIVVPVDGASNIKLEIFDLDSLECVYNAISDSPKIEIDGWHYNATFDEFAWFDQVIVKLDSEIKNNIAIISPVARGASGGLIDAKNNIIDEKSNLYTLAYTQQFPLEVEEKFAFLADSAEQFYQETGAILHFPGSLTLIKRILFESMIRPDIIQQAKGFATYNILMSGYFLGRKYLKLIKQKGNEHTYWMCHTGARNIQKKSGTFSYITRKIPFFKQLIPGAPSNCYHIAGNISLSKAQTLKVKEDIKITPGGHDTALSHVPIINLIKNQCINEIIHVDLGTWTMCACIGGKQVLPKDGYKYGVLVQGTVDGDKIITSAYGGGNDFKYIKNLTEKSGFPFYCSFNLDALKEITAKTDTFILPNINPINHGSGPFPNLIGKIINKDNFFKRDLLLGKQHIIINLSIAYVIYYQLQIISKKLTTPIVLTAGGSKDQYLGRFIAALTGAKVYILRNLNDKKIITETTSLGAAIIGKAAYLNSLENYSYNRYLQAQTSTKFHPYTVRLPNLDLLPIEELPNIFVRQIKQYCSFLSKIIMRAQ